MNTKVDLFLSKVQKWQEELEALRMIILDCGLVEELKWGVPCYTFQKNNIALIHGFKEYCAIGFFKGALLGDVHGILVQQTENSQAARQIRFKNIQEIETLKPILKTYIYQAIEVEKAGLKIDYKDNSTLILLEELQTKLNQNSALKIAFEALTPGRRKAYNLYFSDSKQAKTREARIEKYTQQILNGKGLNDCTCGLSKKMPACDGSHKYLNSDTYEAVVSK